MLGRHVLVTEEGLNANLLTTSLFPAEDSTCEFLQERVCISLGIARVQLVG
jgi:hypothetical protein